MKKNYKIELKDMFVIYIFLLSLSTCTGVLEDSKNESKWSNQTWEDKLVEECMQLRDTLQTGAIESGLIPDWTAQTPTNCSCSETGTPLLLTPYIQSNNIEEARSLARVDMSNLKTVNGTNLSKIESYSGYITVNATANQNIFFWFFPAQKNPSSAPLILWLQGGPGNSGMLGLFKEHGPMLTTTTDQDVRVKENPYTWAKDHSIIYIDSPVGAGFSYGDVLSNTVDDVTENIYSMMYQWYGLFPEYKDNPFFIAGQSYGGKYCPSLAKKIHLKNMDSDFKINLSGIAIGNGWSSPRDQASLADFVNQLGLIDNEEKEIALKIEELTRQLAWAEKWKDAVSCFSIDFGYILKASNYSQYYDARIKDDHPDVSDFKEFVNLPSTRKSIHVGSNPFQNIHKPFNALIEEYFKSAKPDIEYLLDYHYEILLYNGNMDIFINPTSVNNFINKLHWRESAQFRTTKKEFYKDGNELIGYIKNYGHLKYLTMRNAGHNVPTDQPKWALKMIKDFVEGRL